MDVHASRTTLRERILFVLFIVVLWGFVGRADTAADALYD
jgi:hypothetical protein